MTGGRLNLGYSAHLTILLTTVVGVNIGYTAVIPYLPEFSARLQLGPTGLMVFFAGFAVAKIFGQPLGGLLVDSRGVRTAGVSALVVAVVGMALVIVADTATVAIVGRLLWGLADGIVTPALYGGIAAISTRYDRDPARGYAKLGTTAVLSFAAGPLAVGLLHSFADYRAVLTAVMVLTLVNAVVAGLVLPGRVVRDADTDGEDQGKDSKRLGSSLLIVVAVFGGIDLVANLLWGAMEPLVPLYLQQDHADPTGYSAWALTIGMLTFAVASPLLARLPARLRSPRMAGLGLGVLGLGSVGLSSVSVVPVGLAAMVLFMGTQAYIYLITREGIRVYGGGTGKAWGAFGMVTDLGLVLGPVVGVFLFNTTGDAAFVILGIGAAVVAVTAFVGLGRWRATAAIGEPAKVHSG